MPRTSVLLAALTCAALVATAVPADGAPASARKKDVWTITPTSTIAVDGHGYGHGRGMSQYGSEGAARAGLTSAQIMDFYYPGTTPGQAGGQVKVWITADRDRVLTVVARPGLKVRDLATKQKTLLPDKGATKWRLSAGAGTRTVVSFFKQRWVKWRTLKGDAELAAGGQPITLVLPSGRVAYRGALALRAPKPGQAEAGHGQPAAARQLPQGRGAARDVHVVVAGRAGVAGDRGPHLRGVRARRAGLDGLPDLRHHLVPGLRRLQRRVRLDQHGHRCDRRPGPARRRRAAGVHAVLLQQRRVHAPPARSPTWSRRPDPYDGWSGNPNTSWTLPLTAGNVERNYPAIGTLTSIAVDTRDGNGEWGGRALAMTLVGHGRLGRDHRRGVPPARRPEVELVHAAGDLSVASDGPVSRGSL